MKKNKNGFSLVELLVVISIIAVLSAVLMVNFVGTRERSRDSQKVQDLNAIKSALRMYFNDYQYYPASKSDIIGSGFTGYISNLGDTSFTYNQLDGGNGFLMEIKLEVGAGDDDVNSQLRCGIPVGSTQPSVYAVCAN